MDSGVLNEHAVLEIKRLYDLKTEHGRRIWSHARLGKQFGVSETTIYRVLNNYGTFMRAPAPLPDTPEIAARIEASKQKFLQMMKDELATTPTGEKKNEPGSKETVRTNPDTGVELAPNERFDPISRTVVKLPY